MDVLINGFFDLTVPLSGHIGYTILFTGIIVLLLSLVPKIDLGVEKITKFFMFLSSENLLLYKYMRKYWYESCNCTRITN